MLLTISLISASFAGIAMAKSKTGWQKENGQWFYIEKNGAHKTGWYQENGKWYYLDEYDGAMVANNSRYIDGHFYLFDKKGVMQKNGWKSYTYTFSDGSSSTTWFYLNKNGTAKTSQWFKDGGKWYYLNDYGEMVAGRRTVINGKGYLFGNNGV